MQTDRSRALFGICLYCCCRINEACTLSVNDVYSKGRVRPELLIRKGNTKGKLATRSIPVIEDLRGLLRAYRHPEAGYLFPGRWGKGHINSDSAARILREAFERVGIEGGSIDGEYVGKYDEFSLTLTYSAFDTVTKFGFSLRKM